MNKYGSMDEYLGLLLATAVISAFSLGIIAVCMVALVVR